jgi:hypothetical protein
LLDEDRDSENHEADLPDTLLAEDEPDFTGKTNSIVQACSRATGKPSGDPTFEIAAVRSKAGAVLSARAGRPVIYQFDYALACVYDMVEAAVRPDGIAHDTLTEVHGHPTDPDLLVEVYDLAQRRLAEVEALANGRPFLLRLVGAPQGAPRWARLNQMLLANDERLAAGRQDKDTAANRPGQDVFARRPRLILLGDFDPHEVLGKEADKELKEAERKYWEDELGFEAFAVKGTREAEREDLARLVASSIKPEPTVEECERVIEEVAQQGGVTARELRGKSRERRVTGPRKRAIMRLDEMNSPEAKIANLLDVHRSYVHRVLKEAAAGQEPR